MYIQLRSNQQKRQYEKKRLYDFELLKTTGIHTIKFKPWHIKKVTNKA